LISLSLSHNVGPGYTAASRTVARAGDWFRWLIQLQIYDAEELRPLCFPGFPDRHTLSFAGPNSCTQSNHERGGYGKLNYIESWVSLPANIVVRLRHLAARYRCLDENQQHGCVLDTIRGHNTSPLSSPQHLRKPLREIWGWPSTPPVQRLSWLNLLGLGETCDMAARYQ
jgi:hypothetical protein